MARRSVVAAALLAAGCAGSGPPEAETSIGEIAADAGDSGGGEAGADPDVAAPDAPDGLDVTDSTDSTDAPDDGGGDPGPSPDVETAGGDAKDGEAIDPEPDEVEAGGADGGDAEVDSGTEPFPDAATDAGPDSRLDPEPDPCETLDCDDGDACTLDGCDAAGCTHLEDPCDDGDLCTLDSCAAAVGCEHADVSSACNDFDACTADACDGVLGCLHDPAGVSCDDGNACTSDSCDKKKGCVHADVTASCKDGDACTKDLCLPASGCAHEDASAACDDGSLCTSDSCDPATGCVHLDVSCDDGDPCTVDSCAAAAGCGHDAEALCDDGDVCTDDSCDGGACEHADVSAACDDGDVCTLDTCDPIVSCVHVSLAAGCDDGDACTGKESCHPFAGCIGAGSLVESFETGAGGWTTGSEPGTANGWALASETGGTAPIPLGDTAYGTPNAGPQLGLETSWLESPDFALPGGGVLRFSSFTANESEDGYDAESVLVSNDAGETWHLLVAPEDPGFAIELVWIPFQVEVPADLAGPKTRFRFAYDTVDDFGGPEEAVGFYVDDVVVTPPGLLDCSDAHACTADSCHEKLGCLHAVSDLLCDDGDACTVDDCDAKKGCVQTALACDDASSCTADSCDPESGCVHEALGCDDGDPCTDDGCTPGGGCTHAPTDCDDADACNGAETCHENAGCVPAIAAVEDMESGAPGFTTGSVAGDLVGWILTDTTGGDAPIPLGSTAYGTPNTGPELGEEWSYLETPVFDLAGGGTLRFRSFTANEPNDPYDAESVEVSLDGGETWAVLVGPEDPRWLVPETWVDFEVPVPGATGETAFRFVYDTIDDFGDPLDVAGWFVDDVVVAPEVEPDCDDGLACTADSCDALSGGCVHDAKPFCDDGDLCTLDTCSPVTGACQHAPSDAGCDDGDVCTDDACHATKGCLHHDVSYECDDGNACTEDVCDPVTGCKSTKKSCSESCCVASSFPNCPDPYVTSCVCKIHPFCCTDAWSFVCTDAAKKSCGACGANTWVCGDGVCEKPEDCDSCPKDCKSCGSTGQSCCGFWTKPGCEDPYVEKCVCQQLPGCCSAKWDSGCALKAETACGACGGSGGTCCYAKSTKGCDKDGIEFCVCAFDPFCCDTQWDQLCVNEAKAGCDANCP